MNILALDVTSPKLVVAVSKDGVIVSRKSEETGQKHNALVMPYIESLLLAQGLTVNDIDVFTCVVGPGSFTGIRIGIATIKALAFATKKPCVSINAFEEMAYTKSGKFITAIDALHDNYYYSEFNGSWDNMVEMDCKHIDEIKAKGLDIYFKETESDVENLIRIAQDKAKKGEYTTSLEPLYLRKSQAERDRDGD